MASPARSAVRRVLVVDDDQALRDLLVATLSADGYDVIEAASEEEAAPTLEAGSFGTATRPAIDLLLTDIRMGRGDGLRLGELIQKSGWPISVIFMTAFPDDSVRAEAERLGAQLVAKPFPLAVVRRLVLCTLAAKAKESLRAGRTTFPVLEQRPPRVLVIDDDSRVARTIERTLRGYDIVTTNRASQALEHIHRGDQFDVIICDLMMPEMDGSTFYYRLAHSVPDQAKRVIFVTAGGATEATRDFLASTTQPVMSKPFEVAELRRFVATFVERARRAS